MIRYVRIARSDMGRSYDVNVRIVVIFLVKLGLRFRFSDLIYRLERCIDIYNMGR